MLAIRLQRTGRKGHAQFRMIVQDSRQAPASGKYVALLGSYNPHTKQLQFAKDKAEFYLKSGAHPSPRVVRLLKSEGVKLPAWVKVETKQERAIRNPDKLRKNRPAGAKAPATEAPVKENSGETPAIEEVESTETTAENVPVSEEAKTETATDAEADKRSSDTKDTADPEKPKE